MKLTVIGSSSKGNAYVLQNKGEALLLEAGCHFDKALKATDYSLSKIKGCLVTHEHGDHAKYAKEYLDSGVAIHASEGTCASLRESKVRKPQAIAGNASMGYKPFALGGFHIQAFATKHDAEEPLGFAIWHKDMGTLLFATDTAYIPNEVRGMSQIMIECNYSEVLIDAALEAGAIYPALYSRVRQNHMGIDTCIDALQKSDLSTVRNIILLHISEDHGDHAQFERRVICATGKAAVAARPGLEVELTKDPF